MHRTAAALALVALLVLAGCNTFGDVGTTRQPFDVDEPPRTTTTAAGGQQSPVISFDPVRDTAPSPFDIVAAHERVLADEPYSVRYSHARTYGNGSTLAYDRWKTTFAVDHTTYVHDRRSRHLNDSVSRKLYANGTHVWAWTQYEEASNATPRLLRGANDEAVYPTETGVGDTAEILLSGLITMEVTDVRKLDVVPSGVDEPIFHVVMNRTAAPDPYGNRTLNASLSLYVTESGRIVDYDHEYTYVEDGRTVHVRTRVQYFGVGTATVTPPDWVPENESTGPALDPHPPGGRADRTVEANDSTVETANRTGQVRGGVAKRACVDAWRVAFAFAPTLGQRMAGQGAFELSQTEYRPRKTLRV